MVSTTPPVKQTEWFIMTGFMEMFTTKDLFTRLSICTVEALALKIASVCACTMTQCVSPSYKTLQSWRRMLWVLLRTRGQVTADVTTEPAVNAHGTFLEHGDAQVLLALRMGAAHHGLRVPLLCAVVTHCQDLDLAIVLLETQAIHCCRATIRTDDITLHQYASCCYATAFIVMELNAKLERNSNIFSSVSTK